MMRCLISFISILVLLGCSPNKHEQATLLEQVRGSILDNLQGVNKYEIKTLKMKVTAFDERVFGWIKGEWVACAEAAPLAYGKTKLANKKFIFVNKPFSPLIMEEGKYPENDEVEAIFWRDLCSFN